MAERPTQSADNEETVSMTNRRRYRSALLAGVSVAALLTGCTSHTTAGYPVQVPKSPAASPAPVNTAPHGKSGPAEKPQPGQAASPVEPVPVKSLASLLLSTEAVEDIVGTTLGDTEAAAKPPRGAADDYNNPACAMTIAITYESLGDGDFTGYRQVMNSKSIDGDLVQSTTQFVSSYVDAEKADQVFQRTYGALDRCDGAVVNSKAEPDSKWRVLSATAAGGVADIATLYLDTDGTTPVGWRCDHRIRVKNNVLVGAWNCGRTNGSTFTAAISDQISARIAPAGPAPRRSSADVLDPGKIKSLFVSIQDAGALVGTDLGDSEVTHSPKLPAPLPDHPDCSPLLGPNENSYGLDVEFTGYREASYWDNKDDFSHIVTQQAATFPDRATAAKTFRNALVGLSRCDGVRVDTGTPGQQWQFRVPPANGDKAGWSTIQLTDGRPDTWRCTYELRTQSNVMFLVRVCGYGDPAPVVGQLSARMARFIPK